MEAFNWVATLCITSISSESACVLLLLRISIKNCWSWGRWVINCLALETANYLRLSWRRHASSFDHFSCWFQSSYILDSLVSSKLCRVIQSSCSSFLYNCVFLSSIKSVRLVLSFISFFKSLSLHCALSYMSFVFFNWHFSSYNNLFLYHSFLS